MANKSPYYGGDGAEAPPSPDGDGSSEESQGNEGGEEMDENGSEDSSESTLIPRSILAGKQFNVGDEVVLKIVRMDGDEVEVQYATSKGDDSGDEGKVENRMAKYADKE